MVKLLGFKDVYVADGFVDLKEWNLKFLCIYQKSTPYTLHPFVLLDITEDVGIYKMRLHRITHI